MITTPRTDAEFEKWIESKQSFTDALYFARTLELELAAAREEIAKLKANQCGEQCMWVDPTNHHLPRFVKTRYCTEPLYRKAKT
jgi:hypothetical protein